MICKLYKDGITKLTPPRIIAQSPLAYKPVANKNVFICTSPDEWVTTKQAYRGGEFAF